MSSIAGGGFAGGGFAGDGFVGGGFASGGSAPTDLDLDLVAIVLARVGTRPSPIMVAPGTNAPSITYTLVAEAPVMRLAGPSGLASRTYQLDFRSTDPAGLARIAEATRNAFQGFRGQFGTNAVLRTDYRRLPTTSTTAANGGSSGTFRASAELVLWYRQARPSN